MVLTRNIDDSNNIEDKLKQMTYTGRYMLDKPGPGSNMPYQEDIHMRLQQYGANLHTNHNDIESDLFTLTRKTNRDEITLNNYVPNSVSTRKMQFNETPAFVEQSRTTDPAFSYRIMESNRWEQPIEDPQKNLEMKVHTNVSTRILEKDYYNPRLGDSQNLL